MARPERFGFANVPGADGRTLEVTWVDPSGLLARLIKFNFIRKQLRHLKHLKN